MNKRIKTLSIVLLILGCQFAKELSAQEKFKVFGMAISVKDLEVSIKWYHDILGFRVLQRSEFPLINAKTAFIEGAGIRLELLEVKDSFREASLFADPPNHMRLIGNKALILYVDNLNQITKELEIKKVVFAFKEVKLNDKGLTSTLIRDPDGNFISIFGKKGMIPINQKK
ncbi:VOC family protein [Pedobacter frigiditerrae]|nr:VOC family protein [Pedobacter frigiditerrae]